MSRCDALRAYLEAVDPLVRRCTLTFDELQEVLGFPLPAGARQHRPWWAVPQLSGTGSPSIRALSGPAGGSGRRSEAKNFCC